MVEVSIRRSTLYAPGNDERLMEKALETEADGVIFDLEDSIGEQDKSEARETIRAVASDVTTEKDLLVRINEIGSEYWLDDLKLVSELDLDLVKVPKVDSPWEVRVVDEVSKTLGVSDTGFGVTIETPTGLANGKDIATVSKESDSITNISYGVSDYTSITRGDENASGLHDFVGHQIVQFAGIGDLFPTGTVYEDYRDETGLREFATRTRKMGFVGQAAIHPDQVSVINDVFTPEPEEIERSRRLIDAFESSDKNALSAEGAFLDEATVKRHRRIVELYEQRADK